MIGKDENKSEDESTKSCYFVCLLSSVRNGIVHNPDVNQLRPDQRRLFSVWYLGARKELKRIRSNILLQPQSGTILQSQSGVDTEYEIHPQSTTGVVIECPDYTTFEAQSGVVIKCPDDTILPWLDDPPHSSLSSTSSRAYLYYARATNTEEEGGAGAAGLVVVVIGGLLLAGPFFLRARCPG